MTSTSHPCPFRDKTVALYPECSNPTPYGSSTGANGNRNAFRHSEGMGKVLFSQVSVCSHNGGRGTPIQLTRGTPFPTGGRLWGGEGGKGLPPSFPRGGGESSIIPDTRGVPPSQVSTGGGGRLPPTGTAQHVLATRWPVCLLRSCRGTFLFQLRISLQFIS